ncbi:MAG: hypothetical protein QXW70_02215 [Candidatus Anstonellales archaeon]
MELLRIPSKRVSVLVGRNGQTKKMLQERLGVTLRVNSDGLIEWEGEPLSEYISRDVIMAIGRGFSPITALKLTKEGYTLKIVDLREFSRNERERRRKKARIIGIEGKVKRIIEHDAECDLAVYGNTVSIIAPFETIEVAVNAIFKIMEGTSHSGVFTYLEKVKKRMKEQRLKEVFGIKV